MCWKYRSYVVLTDGNTLDKYISNKTHNKNVKNTHALRTITNPDIHSPPSGATFNELSMEYIIQGPIVYILSNLGVWWWVSRWYRLLQWFSISRVRSRNSTFFSCYIRHNCSHIGSFSTIKTSMDTLDVYQLKYELIISC